MLVTLAAGATPPGDPARAERVLIRAATGEEGHGWLFGSARGGVVRCWIATPAHVVDDEGSGRLRPFVFETVGGVGGESDEPIGVAEVPGALAAAGGTQDLAFARVAAGPPPESCLSRLGLPQYAYDTVLRKAPEVAVFSLLPTSFGLFRAVVVKARSDAARGGLVRLRARSQADAETFLKKGLSGSVAEVEQPQGLQPFAMIIQVDAQPPAALAVRFDLIRAAFEIVEAADLKRLRQERAAAQGVPYRIDGFEGVSRSDGVGPLSLQQGDRCWQVAARGGMAAVRVTVSLADPGDAVRGVSVVQGAGCGEAPTPVAIEQRAGPAAAWSLAAECATVEALDSAPACPLDLRGPRQLRIAIQGRGVIGLRELRIY